MVMYGDFMLFVGDPTPRNHWSFVASQEDHVTLSNGGGSEKWKPRDDLFQIRASKPTLLAFTGGEVCHCISFIILFHNHGTSLYIYVCFVCLWVRPVSPIFGKSSNWSFNIKLNQTNQPCLLILIRRLWVFVSPSLLRWFRLWEQLVRAAQIILLHGIVNASAKFILTPRQDATNCNKMPRHPASNNVVART